MKELARNHHSSLAGSTGRTDALKRTPRMAGAELGFPTVRLDWAGREEAIRLAGSLPRAKLQQIPELSTGEGRSANAIIHAAMA
jgi:hypothetical protein